MLLNAIKNKDVVIMYYDYRNSFEITKSENSFIKKLIALMKEYSEKSSVNFQDLCFINFEQMKTSECSSIYNGNNHVVRDIEKDVDKLKSWNFMSELVSNIARIAGIVNIDFIDIDQLYFPKEHVIIFKKILDVTRKTVGRNINYLKIDEKDKRVIHNSNNWLYTMFTTFYEENSLLLDKYFKVNKGILEFINTKSKIFTLHNLVPDEDQSDIVEKCVIEEWCDVKKKNIYIIPLYDYSCEADYKKMNDLVISLSNNTIIEFISSEDTTQLFLKRFKNNIDIHWKANKARFTEITFNLWFNPIINSSSLLSDSDEDSDEDNDKNLLYVQDDTRRSFENSIIVKVVSSVIRNFDKHLFRDKNKKQEIKNIDFKIYNIPESYSVNYNKTFQYLQERYFTRHYPSISFNFTF